ncbi:hypothetical protein L3Y34_001310 [Caenorhabditis briggsae]|uniref:Uncharacterized protein n=1 Tax=Caenorhabditis briggsae TaxID=6238 RepID=A0AAE9IPI8_CAEBR|nr:hypothetical protein L3Y34_001310 [Caenorhabditis briggsae]
MDQTSSTSRRPGRSFFLLLVLSPLLRTQLTSSLFRLDHTPSVLFSSSLLILELPPSSDVSLQDALPTRSKRLSRSQDFLSSPTQESTTRLLPRLRTSEFQSSLSSTPSPHSS